MLCILVFIPWVFFSILLRLHNISASLLWFFNDDFFSTAMSVLYIIPWLVVSCFPYGEFYLIILKISINSSVRYIRVVYSYITKLSAYLSVVRIVKLSAYKGKKAGKRTIFFKSCLIENWKCEIMWWNILNKFCEILFKTCH